MNESLDQPQPADRTALERPPSSTAAAATPAADHAHEGPAIAKPRAGAQFLTVFPPIMVPMFLAVADQTIVATALPVIASSMGEIERASWVVVAYLIANTIAAPVYGGRGAVRFGAEHQYAHRVSRGAGFWRRRTDDAVASTDRRSHPAARARPLPGLSRRRGGNLQQFWPCGGRLPNPGLRLAVDFPD